MADKYSITIEDSSGLTWALARHNDANPSDQLADEAAYVQRVMEGAAASYITQAGNALVEKVKAMKPAHLEAIRATLEAAVAADVSEKAADEAAKLEAQAEEAITP